MNKAFGTQIDIWKWNQGSNQLWVQAGNTLTTLLSHGICLGYQPPEAASSQQKSIATKHTSTTSAGNRNAPNATCWSGKLEGGDLHTANLTLAEATSWCVAPKNKCAGFSAEGLYPSSCSTTSNTIRAFHFKDNWGASRLDTNAAWTTWLEQKPPPSEYHCEGLSCVPGPARVNFYDSRCLGLCEKV